MSVDRRLNGWWLDFFCPLRAGEARSARTWLRGVERRFQSRFGRPVEQMAISAGLAPEVREALARLAREAGWEVILSDELPVPRVWLGPAKPRNQGGEE